MLRKNKHTTCLSKFVFRFFLATLATIDLSHAQSIETRAFFDDYTVDDIKISPDGKHLALSVPEDGVNYLLILQASDRKRMGLFRFPTNYSMGDFYWANNERIVYSMRVVRRNRARPLSTGAIYALNINGTDKLVIARERGSSFSVSNMIPSDPTRIRINSRQTDSDGRTISSKPESYLLNIDDGVSRVLSTLKTGNMTDKVVSPLPRGMLYSDNSGVPRLAVTTNTDDTVSVSFKAESEWFDVSHLLNEYNSDLLYFEFVGFNSFKDRFYFIAYGENGIKSLYLYNHKEKEKKLIYQHPSFDIRSSNVVLARDQLTVLGVKILGDVLEQYYFEEHPEVILHQSLDAAFPNELTNVISTTGDGSKAVVSVTGAKRAGDFYLLDTESMRLEGIMSRSNQLLGELMADVTPFAIRTNDKKVIHGFVTQPQNTVGPTPLIVIPHDGPFGARNTFLFDREAQFFAHHGFAVLHINFRGSEGYGEPFASAGDREWGMKIIDDITLATKWAIQKKITEKDKICIYGIGFGGYAALTSAAREPNLYRCAAANSGIYDLSRLNESLRYQLPGGAAYLEEVLGVDKNILKQQSPVYNAHLIEAPVFIAHGAKDFFSPMSHALAMKTALENEDKIFEWMAEDDEGHGFFDIDNKIELYEKLLSFISENVERAP
jgi:dipeptidyl aminopeptidase/acylaminoacyl peptidase